MTKQQPRRPARPPPRRGAGAPVAAAFAQRVVLLADGRPIADGPIAEVLTGGWYFATETARIVGALTAEEAAERLRRRMPTVEVTP